MLAQPTPQRCMGGPRQVAARSRPGVAKVDQLAERCDTVLFQSFSDESPKPWPTPSLMETAASDAKD